MEQLHISIENIHCEECEKTILKSVSSSFTTTQISDQPTPDDILALDDTQALIRIEKDGIDIYSFDPTEICRLERSLKKITSSLRNNGFQILQWDLHKNGELAFSSNAVKPSTNSVLQKVWKYKSSRNHLKHCKACLDVKRASPKDETDSDLSVETLVKLDNREFRAVFAIGGMTCASCVSTVSEAIESVLASKVGIDHDYSVNLMQHTAVVIIPNKQLINTIIEHIDETGFECKLIEVLPVERSVNTKITAVIGGITCAACATAIESTVHELPFVLESGVNVVTKTANFVLDGEDGNADKLKEAIEDIGYDFEVLLVEKINYASSKLKARSINIRVNGMMCDHCPEVIMCYLESYGDAVVVQDAITLDEPFIKFTYIPSENVTIRKFLHDLNHLIASESTEEGYKVIEDKGTFECSIVEPVSMEEHLRKLSRKEVIGIVIRLTIATLFAIPTFIFGIVSMSLLPKSNSFKKWMDEPLWAGNVSRETWSLLFLSTPVYFFAADIFHRKAFKEVKALWVYKNTFKKRLLRFGSMSLLMCLGTSIAYISSIVSLVLASQQKPKSHHAMTTTYFDSVVFLTFFLLIGRLLESYSKKKTAEAISDLQALKNNDALLVENIDGTFSNDEKIDIKFLEIGDHIRVVSGESPPIDCVIVDGTSEFDESALTGESKPVKHSNGHQIFSGTVNVGKQSVIAKVINLDGDSLIDQIVSTVRDGQLRKAPIERTADALTSYFVPLITFLAVLTWVIWLALGVSGSLPQHYLDVETGGWVFWSLEFSIAVFVIACPCGIGLAAPTALFVGSGLAAKYGILAKGGGAAFQDGANTNVVCFDKTGTLTNGEVQVTNFSFCTGINEFSETIKTFALQTARDLELASKHPLGNAVKKFVEKYALKENVKLSQNKIPLVETVPGKGLRGEIISGDADDMWNKYEPSGVILGNEALMSEYKVEISETQKSLLNKWKTECKSVILVAMQCKSLYGNSDYNLSLMMAARDQLRAETKEVISFLKKREIDCWMVTGDNRVTAEAIGKEIGIDHIISEVLPDQKQAHIKKLQKTPGSVVAMIGDGINDAPALAAADVGIALSSGTDLAVTLSDFILLNKAHPLLALSTLFDLSRVVFRRVKFNFAWSLVYNTIGIPIAAGVIYPYHNSRLSPVWASAAMAALSISVVLSSLALKFYKPKIKKSKLDDEQNDSVEPQEDIQ